MSTMRIAAILTVLAGSATAEVDPCVVGTWQADLSELAAIMATQMQGTATPVGGMVIMQITPTNTVRIDVDDMAIRVKVPNAPEMNVTVTGYSTGTMRAEGNAWTATSTDYNLVGAADIMGTRMEIPFSAATGMFGSGDGTYTCAGTNLTFQTSSAAPKIPPTWTRLD